MGTGSNDLDQQLNEEREAFNDNETLENFTSVGFKMLVEATKKSNNLPYGKARDLYESCPSFHSIMDKQADYILSNLSAMLKYTSSGKNLQKKDDEDKFEMIVDSNDNLLEKVGILLDELSGIKKNPETTFLTKRIEPISGSWNENKKIKIGGMGATQVLNKILNQTKNIEKPQLNFKDKVNNDSKIPFEPRITYKYNILKPLSLILEMDEYGFSQFSHPYEFELEKFTPSTEQLMHKSPVMYKSLEDTPLVLVMTPEDIPKMVDDLEKYSELAVDLEHHSYRSFQGFTCLMQISTRDTDYIIDALSLRSDLDMLNKVFTNPGIVKVFHGADSDVLWLQRDLALYVVNMFDTHQAAKLLNFPKLSLAYLLSHYCNVNAQKQFQLADWRIRPLPQELITYAREDTHYLLYIYDNLRNSLMEKSNNQNNLLNAVISESTKICLKRYFKPVYDAEGYLDLYRRSKKLFDNRQKFALQKLFEWRDTIARETDESYAYVLPDHMMLNISEVLPREAQGILACCNPIPVLVRQNLLYLHQMILKAREQPLIKPILEEQKFYKYTSSVTSLDNPLQCPHDLNHEGEFRDDLPVLFSGSDDFNLGGKNSRDAIHSWSTPLITVFEAPSVICEKAKDLLEINKTIHSNFYHLYKLSKKYWESVEVKSTKGEINNKKEYLSILPEVAGKKSKDRVEDKKGKKSECAQNSGVNKKIKLDDVIIIDNNPGPMLNGRRQKHHKLPQKRPREDVNSSNERKKKKNKKKRKASLDNNKGFQPFDFNSVDFRKYQSSAMASGKKFHNKPFHNRKRGKKSGKKNFEISL